MFAPGWVFETQDKTHFFNNQDRLDINNDHIDSVDILCFVHRFWSLLSPFCHTLPVCGLPLVSSFGRGFGEKLAIDGKVRVQVGMSSYS